MPDAYQRAAPPIANRIEVVSEVHGELRVDAYAWLRDKPDPSVAAYLEAENAYADAMLTPTKGLQEKLYGEMLSRIKETDDSVPYRQGDYYWYARMEEGKQYPILCRKRGSLDAAEQITLDVNALAEGQPFMALGAYAASDDGRLLAFSTDNTGFRQYTLRVKNLDTGEILPDEIGKTGSVAWAADGQTLFYTIEDAAKRHYRVYRRRLGEREDALVYEERDETFNVAVRRSRSRRYLFISSESHTTSEVRYQRADAVDGEWRIVVGRTQDHEYSVTDHGEELYIRTNDTGRNFRVVVAPIDDPRRERWREIVAHRDDVMIEGMHVFARHYVLQELEEGLAQFRVANMETQEVHRVTFPEPTYFAYPGENREWDTTTFRYRYESLVTPASTFDYEMDARRATLLKQEPVLGGYDQSQYVSSRMFARAADGTSIPVSLVHRSDLRIDGSAAAHLIGYGSYGYPYPVRFDSNRLSLLDRGYVFAIAHIRGGGEMGKRWHDDGRMAAKMNTFTDFIAAAEALIAHGYTSKNRLSIEGGSAGGLLMGAVVNLRPDLFKAVVSHVPFVDVINTMLDASLPLTVAEYEEWGNPNVKAEHDVMLSYSPYDNLEAKEYPAMLVRTSFNDSQVMYWEPAKYVAKLRTLKTDTNVLLLVTNMAAGHGGAPGRYDHLREIALDYAFILTYGGGIDPGAA